MEVKIILEILSLSFFYTVLKTCIMKLILYQDEGKHLILSSNIYKNKNIIDDNEITDEVKIDILDNLLDINSINKCYILYFIFKKQGIFYAVLDKLDKEDNIINDATSNNILGIKTLANPYELLEPFNSYDEYIFWKNIYGDNKFNLDETKDLNLAITINNKVYKTNDAQINFISWLYYSGLYDYLMQMQDIKKNILDEMNRKNLLIGNHFLRYKLFLNEYEDIYQDNSNMHINLEYIDNECNECNDNECNDNECNECNECNDNECNDNECNECNECNDNECNDNECNECNECNDNECNECNDNECNDEEIKKYRNHYDITNIDEYKFLYDLKETAYDLSCRLYDSIKNYMKKKINKLFHEHLD